LRLNDCFTFVYSGSLDGWYLTEEMVDFFASVVRKRSGAHLLWLTRGSHERVRQLMSARGIGAEHFSVRSVTPKEMPAYLAAGDAGISFIKRCLSKLASSPTKNAEYLACGLPIVINSGIGDSDRLAEETDAAVLIEDFSEQDFNNAWNVIRKVAGDPNIKTEARVTAERVFDLKTVGAERYVRLYKSVFSV
jgi:hypothetical protein